MHLSCGHRFLLYAGTALSVPLTDVIGDSFPPYVPDDGQSERYAHSNYWGDPPIG
jgi:hypothetical protein